MSNFRKIFNFLFFKFSPELVDDVGWDARRLFGLKLTDPLVEVIFTLVRVDHVFLHLLLLLEANLVTLYVFSHPALQANVLAQDLVKYKRVLGAAILTRGEILEPVPWFHRLMDPLDVRKV